jgi:hypothetical protein
MKKILLITLSLSVFIWADFTNDEDRPLQDIKTPYTIQDETSETSTAIDSELLPMEQKLLTPEKDVSQDMKQPYSIQDEPVEKPKELEHKYIPVNKSPKITEVKKVTKEESEIEKIRKELNIQGPSAKELKIKKMREELNIKDPSAKEKKIDRLRDELNIDYRVPKYESSLDKRMNDVKEDLGLEDGLDMDSAISSIKRTLRLEDKPKKDEGFSFTNSLSTFGDTIGMDLGIPSFFGSSSKKKESGVLDSVLGFGILGDMRDTGTSLYKGAKYSGQSAEMMSGMMYNSSKMYNTMFGVFDDSPFNIFEEEEEASLFDVIEHGNTVMDMFN